MSTEATITFVPTEVQACRRGEKARRVCGGTGGGTGGETLEAVQDPLLPPSPSREQAGLPVRVKGPGQDERGAGWTRARASRASCGTPAAPAGCGTAHARPPS